MGRGALFKIQTGIICRYSKCPVQKWPKMEKKKINYQDNVFAISFLFQSFLFAFFLYFLIYSIFDFIFVLFIFIPSSFLFYFVHTLFKHFILIHFNFNCFFSLSISRFLLFHLSFISLFFIFLFLYINLILFLY